MSPLVHIRPVIEADLDLLVSLYADPGEASQYGFFGYPDRGRLRRGFTGVGCAGASRRRGSYPKTTAG